MNETSARLGGALRAICILALIPAFSLQWAELSHAGDDADIEKIPEANLELYVGRPRLLFRKTDLPRIRELCKGKYFSIFREMKEFADDYLPEFKKKCEKYYLGDSVKGKQKSWSLYCNVYPWEVKLATTAITYGFLYQVTGEKKYIEPMKDFLRLYELATIGYVGRIYIYAVFVYDLMWDGLTPEERKKYHYILLRLDHNLRGMLNLPGVYGAPCHTGQPGFYAALVLMGLYRDGVDGDYLREAARKEIIWAKQELIPLYKDLGRWRGGPTMEGDGCPCAWRRAPYFLEAWNNMAGENHFTDPAIGGYITWVTAQLLPSWSGIDRKMEHVSGFCRRLAIGGVHGSTPLNFISDRVYITRHAANLYAARSKWGLAQWFNSVPTNCRVEGKSAEATTMADWYKLKNKVKNRIGMDGYLFGNGWKVILGWYDPELEPIPPQQLPETMLFEGPGHVFMRSGWGRDATFALFKSGVTYHGCHLDNNNFVIFKKGDLAFDGGGYGSYAHKSMVHNLITVYDEKRKTKPRGWDFYDGGQVWKYRECGQTKFKGAGIKPHYRAGSLKAFETSPEYDYVCGDAGRSYDKATVTHFYRQFIYIKPDHFVIFDRIGSKDEKSVKRWILQAMAEPVIEGNTFRYGAFPESAGGRLSGITLFPEDAAIEKLGGKGKTYCVYDEKAAVKARFTSWGGKYGWYKTYPWRIFVAPKKKSADDVFLHVLHVDPSQKGKMPARLVKDDRTVGVEIRIGNRIYALTFGKEGAPSGRIRITEAQGGREVLSRPLAATIEDTYKRWKRDQRYEKWMTDKRYRFVIPEKDRRDYGVK